MTERRWYHDAVIYQLHVRAFHDSNGDGIGDFRGLTQKLDYLQDLGVTALWLLPFYPSPLKDDGYDIADYTDVHPAYGTLRDFKTFLKAAHERDLRVITELVVNHTSDQHPWFQRARRAKPGAGQRDYYVWSDTPDRYADARIIFKDFETSNWTWDPVAGQYYWHRFYSHQPDLNYDHPAVHRAVLNALDFWLEMGVDGLRLDAVPYLYERDGTNCENLPETHAFLKRLRRHVDRRYQGRMLLAEANQWPDDAVKYFGDGDECHMAFHFPVMPRLFMALQTEDRFPVLDVLEQTPPIPAGSQWAIFLRNHDELTLEMVTDEDRDYMYRMYARDPRARINLGIRRRLAPLLGNNRRRLELMTSLLFSLPGTPILYYGDEIRMGDNIFLGDRNGVRTPMQWSADRNAGFSRANPQQLYLPVVIDPEYHYEAVNVEAQQNNPQSFLWWMKRLIARRKQMTVFGTGSTEFLHPENRRVLAFLRALGDETVLVVANLSRFVQGVELDLARFKGVVPVEVFGQTRLPPIEDRPYFLTLAPHTFFWLALTPMADRLAGAPAGHRPAIVVHGRWEDDLLGGGAERLERALPGFLKRQRWFGAKGRDILGAEVVDAIPLGDRRIDAEAHREEPPTNAPDSGYLTLIQVGFAEGEGELYCLPLMVTEDVAAAEREDRVVAWVRREGAAGSGRAALVDAAAVEAFGRVLVDLVPGRRQLKGREGKIRGLPARALRNVSSATLAGLPLSAVRAEQSNTSLVLGDRYILKLFRRVEDGVNPELELGRFLTESTSFTALARFAGALEYRRAKGEPLTLAILHEYVPNEGDAWQYTLDAIHQYFEQVLAAPDTAAAPPVPGGLVEHLSGEPPPEIATRAGPYLESARVLGRRTAEMHRALGSTSRIPAFAPEPFTPMYQQSLFQSLRSKAEQALDTLRKRRSSLPPELAAAADQVLGSRDMLLALLHRVLERKVSGMRVRCHGDYHLGQILYTGRDFVVVDFEGEPARALGERRIKRSPLTDVAGLLRSSHYAVAAGALDGRVRPEDIPRLEPWARAWRFWVSQQFLQSYLGADAGSGLLPKNLGELAMLLDVYQLEKALYELRYELNHRPTWVGIPLEAVRQVLAGAGGGG